MKKLLSLLILSAFTLIGIQSHAQQVEKYSAWTVEAVTTLVVNYTPITKIGKDSLNNSVDSTTLVTTAGLRKYIARTGNISVRGVQTAAYSTPYAVDFANFQYKTMPITGPLSLTSLNLSPGAPVDFRIQNQSVALGAPVQSAAATATTGGSLAATTQYFLKVTATNANGETIGSNEINITTGAGATNTVTANWAVVTGATGYKVYIGTATNAEGQYFVVPSGATTSLLITTATGTAGTVPVSNTTAIAPLTFPAGWIFVNGTAPANIAASKTGLLRLISYGTTDADVVAAWMVQP